MRDHIEPIAAVWALIFFIFYIYFITISPPNYQHADNLIKHKNITAINIDLNLLSNNKEQSNHQSPFLVKFRISMCEVLNELAI